MNLVTLKCPNCGADIEIENGIDTFYCKYCGYKIILDGQSDAAINAKVRLKEVESNERIKKEKLHLKYEEKKRADKEANKVGIVALILFAAVFLICFSVIFLGNKGAKNQEKKLQATVDEIMVDIDNGDFAEARVKANTLYWDSSWTSEPKKKWDQTRKEILKQIDKAEKEAEKAAKEAEKEAKKEEKTGWFW